MADTPDNTELLTAIRELTEALRNRNDNGQGSPSGSPTGDPNAELIRVIVELTEATRSRMNSTENPLGDPTVIGRILSDINNNLMSLTEEVQRIREELESANTR